MVSLTLGRLSLHFGLSFVLFLSSLPSLVPSIFTFKASFSFPLPPEIKAKLKAADWNWPEAFRTQIYQRWLWASFPNTSLSASLHTPPHSVLPATFLLTFPHSSNSLGLQWTQGPQISMLILHWLPHWSNFFTHHRGNKTYSENDTIGFPFDFTGNKITESLFTGRTPACSHQNNAREGKAMQPHPPTEQAPSQFKSELNFYALKLKITCIQWGEDSGRK